jgi:DNA replication protein DnaC
MDSLGQQKERCSSRYPPPANVCQEQLPGARSSATKVTAAAMIDRLVHHAEILSLKGDIYRLKDRDLARATPTE